MVGRLRLGVVSYLNAVPLVHGLDRDPRFELVRDVPSRVAERLHADEVDLGMIPSIEYARGGYAIVPGVAITSRGPVRSVRLLHGVPIEKIRRVALDASSRTSVTLARVLLRDLLGRDPDFVTLPPAVPVMLQQADAAVVIGDHALDFAGDVPGLDLGEEWTKWTGLPFVWAFWAGRPGSATADDVRRLQDALEQGLAALTEIAWSYDGAGSGQGGRNEAYLRSNIAYRLGETELAGLREFYRRAHGLGLIPEVPDLTFLGV